MMANLSALLLVSSLLFLKTLDVSSRQFDSLELAVGEWDVNLSCLPEVYEHELFPLKRFEQPDPFTGIPSSSGIFRQSKNFPCLLTMYPNRTFVLAPEPCSSDILPLRGTFLTEGNPYCATDRYFETISFSCFPRRRTISGQYMTVSIDLFGDMHGHFGTKGKIVRGKVLWRILEKSHRRPRVKASFEAFRRRDPDIDSSNPLWNTDFTDIERL